VTPDQLLAACDETTRIVSVSFVSFSNGFRLDIDRLGHMLRERGILFFVDAIQGLGALPLDVTESAIDFLSADGHKWLLAPDGIGMFFVRADLLDRLEMTFVSWVSMKDPFNMTDYDFELADSARRFEFGTPNTMGIHAFRAALDIIRAVGIDQIEHHVLALTDTLCAGLEERSYRVVSPRGEGEKSGIVAFDRPGMDVNEILDRLTASQVQTTLRAGFIRVAVHLYNDASDIRRLLDNLP